MNDVLAQGGIGRLTRGLREQLQTMTAAAHTLASNLDGNEKAAEYLAVLNRAMCVQLRLIRQAELNERLYDENEMRVVLAPTDLAALGRDVMEKTDALVRPLLDIRAEFSSSLAALPTQADRDALEEMLLQFISNSVRAIGRSGTVRLELEQAEDRAVFTVTDTGGGLDPAALAGLFEPEEPEFPARGLVLARRIAALHGGALMAGNTEAGGACLAVSLPIVERARGVLHSPGIPVDRSGGWDPVLAALSGSLPAGAFRPDRKRR